MKEFVKRWIYFFRYLKARYFGGQLSYSQDGDDLKALELLGDVKTFIDIGANDGFTSSNTFLFALKGAEGVCLEPVTSIFRRLQVLYLPNSRITCLNVGISDRDADAEMVTSGLLSYLPETQDAGHRELVSGCFDAAMKKVNIRLVTFATLAKMTTLPRVTDLLSIDVEGHELQVLRSIDFDAYTFRLIIIETHTFDECGNSLWTHRDLTGIEALLQLHGYGAVFRSSVNTFYMRPKD